jgi:predicted RNase H-related nuclease YkuK (DUF458 family)
MIEVYPVFHQVVYNTAGTPPCLPQSRRVSRGIAELHITISYNLSAKLITSLVGCIKAQGQMTVTHPDKVID